MPDLGHLLHLLRTSFSIDRTSLHFISLKRVFFFVFFFPLLLGQCFLNGVCLLLDHLIFYKFKSVQVKEAIFITGLPRSGTSYFFNLLSADPRFTSFKLWEVIFAPSILQKFFFSALIKVDRRMGSPVLKGSRIVEKRIFSHFHKLHALSLSRVEEDEPLMMNIFSSVYLHFLFPENKRQLALNFFDTEVSERKKTRIMNYYFQCVQRHLYVFGDKGKKSFLSKNPSFISRIDSLDHRFAACRFIILERDQNATIPSFISLYESIMKKFCKVNASFNLDQKANHLLLSWKELSDLALQRIDGERIARISYDHLISDPTDCLKTIYRKWFSEYATLTYTQEKLVEEGKQYRSAHIYDKERGIRFKNS